MEWTSLGLLAISRDSIQTRIELDEDGMETTRPVGHIRRNETGGETRNMTQALGLIRGNRIDEDVTMDMTRGVGSVFKNSSLRHASDDDDMTRPLGAIGYTPVSEDTMQMTRSIGTIHDNVPDLRMQVMKPVAVIRPGDTNLQFTKPIRENTVTRLGRIYEDDSMDMTRPVGIVSYEGSERENTMQMTRPIGKIQQANPLLTPAKQLLIKHIATMSPKRNTPGMRTPLKPLLPILNAVSYPGSPKKPLGRRKSVQRSPRSPATSGISLQDFLSMISIDFMDGFLSKSRGHSSFGISEELADTPPTLVDYVVAAQKLPLLNMYEFGAHELKTDKKNATENFAQWEESVLEETPVLFEEYIDASAEVKQIMNSQFQLLKNFARLQARGAWYDWRGQLTSGLNKDLSKSLTLLDHDVVKVQVKKENSEARFNTAKVKHEQLRKRLFQLKKRNEELVDCDRDALLSLQNKVTGFKEDIRAMKEALEAKDNERQAIEEHITKLKAEKQRLVHEIQETEKVGQANRIVESGEIATLKRTYSWVMRCFGWKECNLSGTTLDLTTTSGLYITVDMAENRLMTRVGPKSDLLRFLHSYAEESLDRNASLKQRMAQIRHLWLNAMVIFSSVNILALQFITRISTEGEWLKLTIELLSESSQSKVVVHVSLSTRSIAAFPMIDGQVQVTDAGHTEGNGAKMDAIRNQIELHLKQRGMDSLNRVLLKTIGGEYDI
jgi:hypothetical protein